MKSKASSELVEIKMGEGLDWAFSRLEAESWDCGCGVSLEMRYCVF